MALRLALLALLLAAFAALPSPVASTEPRPLIAGDFDCDADVDSVDALRVLRSVAGVGSLPGCVAALEVDCDGDTDAVDALLVLRHVAGLPIVLAAGCPSIASLAPGTPYAVAADYLAGRITSGDLVESVLGVQQALAWGGVATTDLETVLSTALAPPAANIAAPGELLTLALEARDRETVYRMTAADLGQIMVNLGWPSSEAMTPAEQALTFLTTWFQEAQDELDYSVNFAIFFVAEMLAREQPSVDLADDGLAPEDVHLSLLEVKLIEAAFDRVTEHPPAPLPGTVVAAGTSNPCLIAQRFLTAPFGGLLIEFATDAGVRNKALEKAVENAGGSQADVEAAKKLGKASNALAILSRIMNLINLYSHAQISIAIVGENPVHKNNETDPGELLREFRARAGVSDQDWREYMMTFGEAGREVSSAIRECLAEYGIRVPEDIGELAEDIARWSVEWEITAGSPEHADWSPDHQISPGSTHQGLWRGPLQVAGPYTGETSFVARIDEERTSDHPGALRVAPVVVCGNLETAQPPDAATWGRALTGLGIGLAVSVVDLAAGFIQEFQEPRSCATLYVEFHERCPAFGASRAGTRIVSQGVDESVLPCAWEGSVSLTYTENNPAASITSNLAASGVRFELYDVFLEFGGSYRAVAGTAQWTTSGSVIPNCTLSGSGSYPVNTNNTSQDPLARDAHIRIWDDGGGALRYEGSGRRASQTIPPLEATLTCPDPEGGPPIILNIPRPGTDNWWLTPPDGSIGEPEFRLEDNGTAMRGTWTSGPGDSGQTYTWTWDFTSDVCPVAGTSEDVHARESSRGGTC